MGGLRMVALFLLVAISIDKGVDCAIPRGVENKINLINSNGPYLGLIIPNTFEMNPLLQSSSFTPNNTLPYIDFAGRRFRFGNVEHKKAILVMTGLGMINAGITTQLLISLFRLEGVIHYGIAGSANPSLHIGDVTIAQYWSHTALWNWQRYGHGPEDELALEVNGDYTRKIGYLNISSFGKASHGKASFVNLLNNVWYQPEEVFPVYGTPESRQHVFWVAVDSYYFELSKKLQGVKLQKCLNATICLSTAPRVTTVSRGTSASIFLDNAAYRTYIYEKFNVSPVDMESAAVALICHQQKMPYIIIRGLSDLAGGGSAQSNEAATFSPLTVANSVQVVLSLIKNL